MTKVALFSAQTILTAGFQSVFATLDEFVLSGVCTTLPQLMEHLDTEHPTLLLIETTSGVTLDVLNQLKVKAHGVSVVLLVDTISLEFVSQALSMGVRGILRKTLSLDLHVKCLQKVAAGELWLEKGLSDTLLSSRRIALTTRERQLMGLVAQGLRNKEVAFRLSITEGTVKVYLSRLFQKVGANDRFELALFALKNMAANQTGASEVAKAQTGDGNAAGEEPTFMPTYLPSFVCVGRDYGVAR